MAFSVVRLGKDSVSEIIYLNDFNENNDLPFEIDFSCTQVEEAISVGSYVLVWLGSDNNKGQDTNWKQGLRAIGEIVNLERGATFNSVSKLKLRINAVMPESIDRFDFLERSSAYYKHFSRYPVVGVSSNRNNAIQRVKEGDQQRSDALLSAISVITPSIRSQLGETAPALLDFLDFIPVGDIGIPGASKPKVLLSNDVLTWVKDEIFRHHERNFLFLGAPGTGKTFYAREVALALAGGDPGKVVFTQFHPSFSYDDFVEGYVPTLNKTSGSVGYSLERKHFLKLCEAARNDANNLYVLVVDELSRGDPARVFGEVLTYLETSHRNELFDLAYSGDQTFVPSNLVLIATANPFDRSVGELDDALLRRFVMREFPPDFAALSQRLKSLGASGDFIEKISQVFQILNDSLPSGFGHANFWNLMDEDSFQQLWYSRIRFILRRAFAYDTVLMQEVQDKVEELFPSSIPEPSSKTMTSIETDPNVQSSSSEGEGQE